MLVGGLDLPHPWPTSSLAPGRRRGDDRARLSHYVPGGVSWALTVSVIDPGQKHLADEARCDIRDLAADGAVCGRVPLR